MGLNNKIDDVFIDNFKQVVPGAIRIAKEKALKKCQRANDIAAVTALLDDDDFVDDPDLQNSAGTIL